METCSTAATCSVCCCRTLLRIPVPRFVVFYNGTEHAPERYELRLSDAFIKEADTPQLELVCQVYNINRENILKDFLIEHRQEVTRVMTMDYTFERRLEFQREEAAEEGWRLGEEYGRKLGEEHGRELGERDGMQKKRYELIRKKLFRGKSLEQIADELEETPDGIRALYEQIQAEL